MKIHDSNQTLFDDAQDFDLQMASAVHYNLSDNQTFQNWTELNYSQLYLNTFNILLVVFYSIIFVLGTVGNGLVIWIAGFRIKTASAVWFLNLAIADFICCASIPFQAVTFYDVFDLLIEVIWCINMCTSVYLLTAMSIDRCVSIMRPFWSKTHRTPKFVCNISAIVWVVSIIITSMYLILSYSTLSYYQHALNVARFVTMFIIPFSVILMSYCLIFIKLRKVKIPKRKHRPYKIITAVILCFFICTFPFHICPLFVISNYILDNIIPDISILLIYFNSCINPILYVLIDQNIKETIMHSLPSRTERVLID